MRNEIINGNLKRRIRRRTQYDQLFTQYGYTPTWLPVSGGPDELIAISGLTGHNPVGYLERYGGGPGGGGSLNFQVLDIPQNNPKWPHDGERMIWLQWTTMPNPADLSQSSGWEPGSVNPDGSPRHTPGFDYPWRISILEHGIKFTEAWHGGWLGYSFYAYASGADFPIRPMIASYFKAGDYLLHELQQEVTIPNGGPVATEVCGFFYMPPVPDPKRVHRDDYGSAFVIDTTHKTPGTIMMYDFKLGFFGYEQPTIPAQDIKTLVEYVPI
jgi:hypothetical protein